MKFTPRVRRMILSANMGLFAYSFLSFMDHSMQEQTKYPALQRYHGLEQTMEQKADDYQQYCIDAHMDCDKTKSAHIGAQQELDTFRPTYERELKEYREESSLFNHHSGYLMLLNGAINLSFLGYMLHNRRKKRWAAESQEMIQQENAKR